MNVSRFLFLISSLLSASQVQSQVTLSEVMFDPAGSEFHDEFVEIVNLAENQPVDLSGWQLSDGSGIDNLIPFAADSGMQLQPGQFAVILDGSYFDNSDAYDTLIPEQALVLTIDNNTFGSGGFLNSGAETVSLLDPQGSIISEYTYSIGNNPGFSDEKVVLTGPNTSDNWRDSVVLSGTPGRQNSVSPKRHDLAVFSSDIHFTPERILSGGSALITAGIKNLGTLPASDFTVTFFEDSDGDSLAEFEEQLAQPFVFQGSLAPADSAEFSLEYQNLAPGYHLIMVTVDLPEDENPDNDIASKSFTVGFPEHIVRINEIMYSPLSGGTEWIEVVNSSSQPLSLDGWFVTDSDTAERAFLSDIELPQNGFLAIAKDSTLLDMFHPPAGTFVFLNALPALNNDSDAVALYDITGERIDRVDYSRDWGGASGFSLEKVRPDLPSNTASNWSTSVATAGGTPGEQNSIFADTLPENTVLNLSPNPFSPDGDGVDDFLLISYQLPLTTAAVNIKIYDLRGRLIRFLANNRASGSQSSLVWDGNDDRGQLARIGIYIVYLQALNARAGVIEMQKKSVVLAGRL